MKIKLYFMLGICIIFFLGSCENEEALFSTPQPSKKTDLFFLYSEDDPSIQDLFLYLKEVEQKDPFIEEFMQTYGTPVWDKSFLFSSPDDVNFYVPIRKLNDSKEIKALWSFYFENGQITHYPLEYSSAEAENTEALWMFDYFTQQVFNDPKKEGIMYVPLGPEETEGVSLRGYIEVVTCVGAWVKAGGGQACYKGMHCWVSQREWVNNNSSSTISSEKNYNNMPGGGGSTYTGTIPKSAQYTPYSHIAPIFGLGSSLSSLATHSLDYAIHDFKLKSPAYNQIMNNLINNNIKIKFKIKPDLPNGYAAYDKRDTTIYFKSETYIHVSYLTEELIHATQHLMFYHNQMSNQYKNYEFEAKVFQDVATAFYDPNAPVAYIGSANQGDNFMNDYTIWILDIVDFQYFRQYDVDFLNDLCRSWTGYSGSTLTNFNANMLRYYFRRQPQQP